MPTQQSLNEQKRKLTAWSKYFSANNQVISLSAKPQSEETKIAQLEHSEFLTINFNTIENI